MHTNFNPRSREGSDAFARLNSFRFSYFNPRSREGSDGSDADGQDHTEYFNPRSREGSDLSRGRTSDRPTRFQSTLPRRERPYLGFRVTKGSLISIHAPAKGATELFWCRLCVKHISIHAPAKGATLLICSLCLEIIFQSTLPRRERRVLFLCVKLSHNFNPRSREGSDEPYQRRTCHKAISIHAPAKGATKKQMQGVNPQEISIHAPAKGATAISAKNPLLLSAKINNFSNYKYYFTFYKFTIPCKMRFICAFFLVRIPRYFHVCFVFAPSFSSVQTLLS